MLKKRGTFGIYYIAMLFACIGMSLAFIQANTKSIFLQLSVISVAAFAVMSISKSRGRMQFHCFICVLLAALAVFQIIIKLMFYERFLLTGPLITIACFLVIIALLFYSCHRFSFFAYFLINGFGAILLSIGMFMYSNDLWGVVTIGAINPQTLGTWSLVYAIGALLSLDYFLYKVRHKFLFLIFEMTIIGLMLYFSWITEVRFSIIIIIALLIFRVLPILNIFNKRSLRILVAFSPMIFALFFIILYTITETFHLMDGGSLLNGRERIWVNYLDQVLLSPVFGIGYNNIDASTFYSHNIFVDYCVLFGVFVPIIFHLCLAYILVEKVPNFSRHFINGYSSSRLKYDSFISFLFLLIASSVEGSLFLIGAGGIFVFSFSTLLIALSEN